MRIAHFSDCHVELRQPEIRRALEFIAYDAVSEHADLLVDAGDWYDGATRAGERNESTALQQLLRDAAPLLAVVGNHGDPRDLGPQFTEIGGAHPVHVAHQPEIVYFVADALTRAGVFLSGEGGRTRPGDLLILCLPWLRKAALVDPATLVDGEDLGAAALAKLRSILDGWRDVLAAHEGPALLVAHADVAGRVRSAGEPPETGEELVIPAAWLRDLDPRGRLYVALGHEHDAQAFAPHVRYSGTPAPTTYGEAKPKSYCLVDLAADRAPDVEERRTPVAPLVKIEGIWGDGAWEWSEDHDVIDVAGAKVRLRYHYLDHERSAARAAALSWADELRARGALEVAFDPKQRQILRRRTEEGAMARARSTAEKLGLWYAHIEREEGAVVPALQKDRLAVLLAEIEREAGVAAVTAPGVAVAFDAIRVRGLGPFRELAELRLDALAGRLVAFVGPNGAGKSTFLGMAFALLYREHPDGWQLVDRAHGTAALIEGDVRVGGERWTLRLKVNGNSRKMEAYVLDAAGNLADPSMARGSTGAYDAWIAARFPSREVARATLFAGQKGTGDLLDASAAKRREALVQMLGQGHLQTLAARVRDRLQPPKDRNGDGRKGLREKAEGLRGALSQQEAIEATLEEREQAAAEAEERAEQAAGAIEEARAQVAAAREVLAAWEASRAEIVGRGEAARAKAEAAKAAHEVAFKAVQDHQQAVEEAQQAWRDRHGELRAAEEASAEAAKLGALEEALARAVAEEREAADASSAAYVAERRAAVEETDAKAALTVAHGEVVAAEKAIAAAQQDVGRAEQAAAGIDGARRAGQQVGLIDALLTGAREHAADVERRIAASEAWGEDYRQRGEKIAREQFGLETSVPTAERIAASAPSVPCGGTSAFPTCQFLKDAAEAEARLPSLRERLAAANAAWAAHCEEARDDDRRRPDGWILPSKRGPMRREAAEAIEKLETERRRHAAESARLPDLERAAALLDQANTLLAASKEHHAAAVAAEAAAKAVLADAVNGVKAESDLSAGAAKLLREASERRAAAEQARDLARKAVERAGALDVLRDRLADSDAAVKRAEAALERAKGILIESVEAEQLALVALLALRAEAEPYGNSKRPVVDEGPVNAAVSRHTLAASAAATAAQALATVREAAAKAEELRAQLALAEQAEQDHELLLRALDKTGIQALEIDAAAPEISELVNRLLEGTFDDRFTFLLDTKERGADGKEREGLPFYVLDAAREGSRPEEARTVLSGGEAAIVGWALRLAVAIYANQQAGVTGGDIFGDEPGAGLRGANVRRFVGLLRRAVDLGELGRLCWIPAEGEAVDLADVRVQVGGGRVAVEGRGEAAPAPLALEAVA